jgi:hypothetical protein
MKYAEIGSISTGTLRSEDLIKTFSSQLAYYARINPELPQADQRYALTTLYNAAKEIEEPEEESELIIQLMNALDIFSPPGHHFGAHPGDGADFGWWPNEE